MSLKKQDIIIPFTVGIDSRKDEFIADGMATFQNVAFDQQGAVKKHSGFSTRNNQIGRIFNDTTDSYGKPVKFNTISPSGRGSQYVVADFASTAASGVEVLGYRHGVYEHKVNSSTDGMNYIGRYYVGDTEKKFSFAIRDSSCKSVYSIYSSLDPSGQGYLYVLTTFNLGDDDTATTKRVYISIFSTDGSLIRDPFLVTTASTSFSDPKVVAYNDAAYIYVETTKGTLKTYKFTNPAVGTLGAGDIDRNVASGSAITTRGKWDVAQNASSAYLVWVTTATAGVMRIRRNVLGVQYTSAAIGTVSCGGFVHARYINDPASTNNYIAATFKSGTATAVLGVGIAKNTATTVFAAVCKSTLNLSGSNRVIIGTRVLGVEPVTGKISALACHAASTTVSISSSAAEVLVHATITMSTAGTITSAESIGDCRVAGSYCEDADFGENWVILTQGTIYGASRSLFFAEVSSCSVNSNFHTYSKASDGVYSGPRAGCLNQGFSKYIISPISNEAGVTAFDVLYHEQHRDGSSLYNRSGEPAINAAYLGAGSITRVSNTEAVEIGFGNYPVIVSDSNVGGGSVTTATMYTKVVFEYINSAGELDQSAPAVPAVTTVTTSTAKLSIVVAACPFMSAAKMTESQVVLYCATAVGGPFTRQVLSSAVRFPNIRRTYTVSVYTTTGAALYTDDGTLDNYQPPAGVCHISDGGRMVVTPHDPDGLFYLSQKKRSFYEYEFCGSYISVATPGDGGSPVTAASLGGVTYLICRRAIYALSGDGPDPTGQGGYFSPQKVADVGVEYANQVCKMRDRIIIRSKDGRKYALSGMSIEPFGTEIDNDDTYTSIAAMVYLENQKELWIIPDTTTTTNVGFIYHEATGAWSKTTLSKGIKDACYSNGRMVAVYQPTTAGMGPLIGQGGYDGYVTSVYTAPNVTSSTYRMDIATPWISPAGFEGSVRLYDAKILGYLYSSAVLNMLEYEKHGTTAMITTSKTQTGTGPANIKWRIDRVGDSFKLRLYPGSTFDNRGRLTGVQLTVGVKGKKMFKTTEKA